MGILLWADNDLCRVDYDANYHHEEDFIAAQGLESDDATMSLHFDHLVSPSGLIVGFSLHMYGAVPEERQSEAWHRIAGDRMEILLERCDDFEVDPVEWLGSDVYWLRDGGFLWGGCFDAEDKQRSAFTRQDFVLKR